MLLPPASSTSRRLISRHRRPLIKTYPLRTPHHLLPAACHVSQTYTLFLDVPGMTKEDIKLSRQNVTTIVKGQRSRPYPELQVHKVERSERTYGDFTLTFAIPQEYERRWSTFTLKDGVLRLVFTPDADEDGLVLSEARSRNPAASRAAS